MVNDSCIYRCSLPALRTENVELILDREPEVIGMPDQKPVDVPIDPTTPLAPETSVPKHEVHNDMGQQKVRIWDNKRPGRFD